MDCEGLGKYNGSPSGLYIHVPFCLRKCPYCNFFSVTDLSQKRKYVDAVIKEMKNYQGRRLPVDTVYFGGGTPSLLTPEQISLLLEQAGRVFNLPENAEITLEANPGAVAGNSFRGYLEAGVNRLNIGIQSFQRKNLQFLGRIHSAEEAKKALIRARQADFKNIGIDLIYGLPGQRLGDWRQDLRMALSFAPEHLSCYMLTHESDTPMGRAKKKGLIHPIEERDAAELFSYTMKFLSENGYPPYEISNFAKFDSDSPVKFRSRHNQKYWNFISYIGLGASAHSFSDSARFQNCSAVGEYIRLLRSGKVPVYESETLNREQRIIETIFLRLRTIEGVNIPQFREKFDLDFAKKFALPLERLIEKNYLFITKNRCALTFKGMRFHNSICSLLIDHITE